jgi:hypothetical protein
MMSIVLPEKRRAPAYVVFVVRVMDYQQMTVGFFRY